MRPARTSQPRSLRAGRSRDAISRASAARSGLRRQGHDAGSPGHTAAAVSGLLSRIAAWPSAAILCRAFKNKTINSKKIDMYINKTTLFSPQEGPEPPAGLS